MTATVAAEKAAKHPAEKDSKESKEKDKVEKRRALGRGLESLLPGPRVVTSPPASGGAAAVQGSGIAGEQQVPHFVRNDNVSSTPRVGDMQAAVADERPAGGQTEEAASPPRPFGESAKEVAPGFGGDAVTRAGAPAPHETELRPVGPFDSAQGRHPGAAVPTATVPASVTPRETIEIHAQAESRAASTLVVSIPLDHIDKNPYQTRYLFDQELLEELADSIKANGVVQPVVVRPAEDGRYVLILGERRCRASKMAGKTTIPAIVKRVSDQQAAEMTVIENLQREDLNCLEQAEAFRVLSQQFNLTQQQIGDRVGMSRESVSNYMRLLKLPLRVMEYLTSNKLGFSEARELLRLEDPEQIAKAADDVVKHHMSIEQIEDMLMRMRGFLPPLSEPEKRIGARWVDPNVRAAQMELERLLQVRVRIRDRKGKGKIVIEYHTVDDYERVVDALRGKKS